MAPQLPAPLRPWRPWLTPLTDEVRGWLGTALLALRPLLPAPGSARAQTEGEFGGYRGISRRGLPERLLMTEWLYAQELPDEFLRRQSSGESLYLDPEREDRAAHRLQLLLFDSGPAQRGACRLAHLVLWILLAQQVEAARQRWAFGSLQDDLTLTCEDTGHAGMLRLLDGRSSQPVEPEMLERWRTRLADCQPATLWLIGAPETPAPDLPHGCRLERLNISDLPLPGSRALAVANARARITLDLPPPRLAARLLRDPLSAGNTPAPRKSWPVWSQLAALPLKHRVLFSSDGHRMLVRLADDRSLLQVVPNAPHAVVPAPKILMTTAQTLAVRVCKRSVSEVRRSDAGVWQLVNGLGLPGVRTVELRAEAPHLASGGRWHALWRCGDRLLLLDGSQRLHGFVLASGGGVAQLLQQTAVLGLDVREQAAQYRCVRGGAGQSILQHSADRTACDGKLPAARKALLGSQIFLETEPRHWWTRDATGVEHTCVLQAEEQVVGCWGEHLLTHIPGQEGVRTFRQGKPRWLSLPGALFSPSLSPLGVLAWFTRDRELVLYSLSRQCELRRFSGGGSVVA